GASICKVFVEEMLKSLHLLYQKSVSKSVFSMVLTSFSKPYIDLNSRALCGQVFEIVLHDLDSVILHSRDRKILFKLKAAGCFEDSAKPSLIHDYVNTKVY
ncbi:hypothetical protein KHM83_18200, partial [Fusibacter paucivorans]|nr:hypothetical protein [Fusibacter paucivorans]